MPTKLVYRINLDMLFPEFLERLLNMVADCQSDGADYYAISGFRSYQEQAKLYFQGRTTPGKIVTNAQPGESAHNFGLAVDFARDADATREGLQPIWTPEAYKILGKNAAKHGLLWGGTFKSVDMPHVQLPGYVTSPQLAPLRSVFKSGDLKSVWEHVRNNG